MELSRKDFFAAHAPEEIPEWFEGPTVPRLTPPERPAEIADAIRMWLHDSAGADLRSFVGDGTLHIALADRWQDEFEAYSAASEAAQDEEVVAHYIAWRVWYGNRMAEAVK